MLCKCGFPVPPPPMTIKEGFFGGVRVIKEREIKCNKCGRINKRKG